MRWVFDKAQARAEEFGIQVGGGGNANTPLLLLLLLLLL